VLTTPNDGIAKYLAVGDRLESVDFLKLDRREFQFDWTIASLDKGWIVTTEKKNNRYVLVGDVSNRARAQLEVKAYIPIPKRIFGQISSHFTIASDGTLIGLTNTNRLIAVDLNTRSVTASYELPKDSGVSFHNAFPIDANGRLFLSTQSLLVAVDWDGTRFTQAWSARYDMRGPGCEGVPLKRTTIQEVRAVARGETCTGSGTTPTLLGDADTGLVVIVDGHAPKNNLVAFWRVRPPSDWSALPDPTGRATHLDRQVAGVFPLPYSSPEGDGFTAENSPAVLGTGVIIAQWAGFSPAGDAPRGLQRVDWDGAKREFSLTWTNPAIHYNGVPTIACKREGDCMTYGMGVYGDEYQYVTLDFDTGEELSRIGLGTRQDVLDQGNNHAVLDDGSIVYSGRFSMVRIQ
jgi:hypothetical protein